MIGAALALVTALAPLTALAMPVSGDIGLAVAIPEARYDAVIPQLTEWVFGANTATVFSIATDTSIFDRPDGRAIARIASSNFLHSPTVIVGVDRIGEWERVLTPARQLLPSTSNGPAAAQTSGWIPVSALEAGHPVNASVVISASAKTLTVMVGSTVSAVFAVGVGTAGTPTPTGVTGYLQARYLDPAQEQSRYPVQLTSLHSSAADEPFGGNDGGLIGLHYERNASGAVSHGCVRLPAAAIEAVNTLPLGTLVTIIP